MEIAGVNLLKFVFALIFVLGLIGALAVVARRMGLGHRGPIRRGGARRLEIVDSLTLDPKRRLLLIRRDDIEHLIVLGAGGETVVEAGIGRDGRDAGTAARNLALASVQGTRE